LALFGFWTDPPVFLAPASKMFTPTQCRSARLL
jgi:hypothetical protein